MNDPALEKTHRQNAEHLIQAAQNGTKPAQGTWYKLTQKLDTAVLPLDIAAFANTPGGPYEGYRYVILGIEDTPPYLVKGIQWNSLRFTVDTEELQDHLRDKLTPYLDVQAVSHKVQNKFIQIIVIPPTTGNWYIVADDPNAGFWVRRRGNTVRANEKEFEERDTLAYIRAVEPLRRKLQLLDHRIEELRTALRDTRPRPPEESAADFAREHFLTPDDELLARIRRDSLAFRTAHNDLLAQVEKMDLGNILRTQKTHSKKTIRNLKVLLERSETLTRPFVETISVLIQAKMPNEVILNAAREIAELFGQQAYPEGAKSGVLAFAMYPALLLLYGAAVVSLPAVDLSVLQVLLNTPIRRFARSGYHDLYLASLLNHTDRLEKLFSMVESEESIPLRLERLLLQNDWIGAVLPLLDQSKTFYEGEALLTLVYTASVAFEQYGGEVNITLNPGWCASPFAEAFLRTAVARLRRSQEPVLMGRGFMTLAVLFGQADLPVEEALRAKMPELFKDIPRRR